MRQQQQQVRNHRSRIWQCLRGFDFLLFFFLLLFSLLLLFSYVRPWRKKVFASLATRGHVLADWHRQNGTSVPELRVRRPGSLSLSHSLSRVFSLVLSLYAYRTCNGLFSDTVFFPFLCSLSRAHSLWQELSLSFSLRLTHSLTQHTTHNTHARTRAPTLSFQHTHARMRAEISNTKWEK